MIPFHLELGFLWLAITFTWLFLSPCLHLWYLNASRKRRERNSSPLPPWVYNGIISRVAFTYVTIWWGLVYLWGDDSIFLIKYGALALIVILSIRGVFIRFSIFRRKRCGFGQRAIPGEKRFFPSRGIKNTNLGSYSEESKSELNEERMLSLWYNGLNKIYAQKFRSEGRWLGIPFGHTPPEYLRSWASDNPYLRASSYYCKSMLGCFAVVVVLMLYISKNVMIFVGFWDDISHIPAIGYDWSDLILFSAIFFAVMIFPLIYLYNTGKEWRTHYRTLSRALSEGRAPDLCDRARMEEMRRTILGWAWNSGYVRYDREKGWRLNAPSRGSKGGRLIE